jgi:hypothetical protein
MSSCLLSYLGGVFDCAATISCGSDTVMDPITGWIIIQQSLTKHPTWYSRKNINEVDDIQCYTKPGDNAVNWKIVLPNNLIVPTIRWYHQVTGAPREQKALSTHTLTIL